MLAEHYEERARAYLHAYALAARASEQLAARQIDRAEAAALLAEARRYLGPDVVESEEEHGR